MKHLSKLLNNEQEKVTYCSSLSLFDPIICLVAKPPIYPNHVLHPEVIPSLNEVPAELNKRRNIRFTDPLAIDSFETEIPLAIASSLQDELERAVQHRFVCLSLLVCFSSFRFSFESIEQHMIEIQINIQQEFHRPLKTICFKVSVLKNLINQAQ